MKFKLIYPKWKKLDRQTEFYLPPHGPVVFAATLPHYVNVEFVDENVQPLELDDAPDFVGISLMLTAQVKRGWQIADHYRSRNIKVICGGIAAMLHAEETITHADSVFLGEAEGRMESVFEDFKCNRLRSCYDFRSNYPQMDLIGPARRSILNGELYNYRGVQMFDLVHASRGCRFNCYPCCVNFLGGRQFRPRPYNRVVEEIAGIENNRLFFVDNSLAQDKQWELGLFREIASLKKKWCCHPIEEDAEVLAAAANAGAWYVYQAVFDTSDHIRNRIRLYHDYGIAVEGTILLGLDDHTEDSIKRLIDFLLEEEIDMAEFTILTPFPHTRAFSDFNYQQRITSYDWNDYTCDRVVFQPRHIKAERLQELYYYAWDLFYRDEPQNYKMFKLMQKVVEREKADNTFVPRRRDLAGKVFGREDKV